MNFKRLIFSLSGWWVGVKMARESQNYSVKYQLHIIIAIKPEQYRSLHVGCIPAIRVSILCIFLFTIDL
jgi:hypothetical protein